MSRKRVTGVLAVAVLTAGIAFVETVLGRRVSRKFARAVTRRARYESGRLEGLRYRLAGRHPDPDVDDLVLADRVRSTLGPMEHRLDIPRLHVQVQAHEVLLHGDVVDQGQAATILEATRAVPGVRAVHPHLCVGLLPGDTRPSEGARHRAASAG
jgi:BON domain